MTLLACKAAPCSKPGGWTFDPSRNMWVCAACRKPSILWFDQDENSPNRECEYCFESYTADKLPESNFACEDCR